MARLIIVEDDPVSLLLMQRAAQGLGHRVNTVADGARGLQATLEQKPDLVVLDVNLPQLSGFEICAALRRASYTGGILVVSARYTVDDKVAGLGHGADDYMVKPLDPREFLARIAAILRRHERTNQTTGPRKIGNIEIDLRTMKASKEGRDFPLTKTEWKLLDLLLQHEGRPVSRERILDTIWGYEQSPTTRTIDTHVYRLRRKLGLGPGSQGAIENVHGEGYVLRHCVE